jgi:hypothetical protein
MPAHGVEVLGFTPQGHVKVGRKGSKSRRSKEQISVLKTPSRPRIPGGGKRIVSSGRQMPGKGSIITKPDSAHRGDFTEVVIGNKSRRNKTSPVEEEDKHRRPPGGGKRIVSSGRQMAGARRTVRRAPRMTRRMRGLAAARWAGGGVRDYLPTWLGGTPSAAEPVADAGVAPEVAETPVASEDGVATGGRRKRRSTRRRRTGRRSTRS